MYGIAKRAFCLVIGLVISLSLSAQEFTFGIRNSFKGPGIVFEHTQKEGSFNSYALSLDIYGLPTGRSKDPGAHFNFCHNIIFTDIEHDGVHYSLYWGSGFSLGYVHDFEKGFFSRPGGTVLRYNQGFMAAMSGDFGCRFLFRGAIGLDLRMTGEFGFHLKKNEIYGNPNLSCYLNGVLRALYPQLTISYSF